MDIGSILGFIFGATFMIVSLFLSAEWDANVVMIVVDAPSVMITVGGTIACTLVGYPISRTLAALKVIGIIFKPSNIDPSEAINKIISLANLARKEGILALEEAANSMDDKFLQKGVMLIVDGTDPDLVRNILETELAYIDGRHGDVRGVWEYIASMGPAWGMIGTLIGLIMMLGNLNDIDTLGAKMAVALVTTFYGSVIANFLCLPVANKMKVLSGDEMLIKEVLIEGMLSIQAGENPRIIEEKLKAFLAPALRGSVNQEKSEKAGD